jgi:apolipoprotein N-acyltransferase
VTSNDWIGIWGLVLAIIGLSATIVSALDLRRQRSKREKAVIAAFSVIERTYGLLVGIKPFVAPLGKAHLDAVNDGLEAINQQRNTLNRL